MAPSSVENKNVQFGVRGRWVVSLDEYVVELRWAFSVAGLILM